MILKPAPPWGWSGATEGGITAPGLTGLDLLARGTQMLFDGLSGVLSFVLLKEGGIAYW